MPAIMILEWWQIHYSKMKDRKSNKLMDADMLQENGNKEAVFDV